jgi:hypothetical protein
MSDLDTIQKKILSFRNERDWAHFHDPTNLAEALSIEAGELLENFLWKTTEQSRNLSPEELKNIKEELGRHLYLPYLFQRGIRDRFAQGSGKENSEERSKVSCREGEGSSKKYTHY